MVAGCKHKMAGGLMTFVRNLTLFVMLTRYKRRRHF